MGGAGLQGSAPISFLLRKNFLSKFRKIIMRIAKIHHIVYNCTGSEAQTTESLVS